MSTVSLTKRHSFFINEAIAAAEHSNMQARLGAVLHMGGKNFTTGFNHHRNKCKTKCVTSYHAELDALSGEVRGSHQRRKGGY